MAGIVVFHSVPSMRWLAEASYGLALALVGYAVTRLASGHANGAPINSVVAGLRLLCWGGPAVVTVLLGVLIFAITFLPPDDLRDQGWMAAWTAVGLSGQELTKLGPYRPDSVDQPLMAFWIVGTAAILSAIWIVIISVVQSGRRVMVLIATGGGLISLFLEIGLRREGLHQQAFFSPITNAWPFLLGAGVAILIHRDIDQRPEPHRLDQLALIAWPFHLVFWPAIALARMILGRPLSFVELTLALIAAAVVAVLIHLLVERPVRRLADRRPRWVAVAVATGLSGVAVGGLALFSLDGLPQRADVRLVAEAQAAQVRPLLQVACHVEGRDPPPDASCTVPRGSLADVVLWGNSHAAQLHAPVRDWSRLHGLSFRQATKSGCGTLLTPSRFIDADCLAFNRTVVDDLSMLPPRILVVGAAWTLLLERLPGDDAGQIASLAEDLEVTLRLLRRQLGPGTRIVLLATTPDYPTAPNACHARRSFLGLDTSRCDRARPLNADTMRLVDRSLAAMMARHEGVWLFRPSDVLCEPSGLCRTRSSSGPWYADRLHMSVAGAEAQSAALRQVLDNALASGSSTPRDGSTRP